MAARWHSVDQVMGVATIGGAGSATALHKPGTIIKAQMAGITTETDQGLGEFIYLLGVASTLEGLLVSYNATTFQTVLAPNTANLDTPLAVAMGASLAGFYAWYQIEGVAKVKKTAVAVSPQVALFLSATVGRVKSTATTGKQVVNAKSANLATVASGTSTVYVLIQRPFAQGQII